MKEIIDYVDFIEIKNRCSREVTIKRMTSQAMDW